MSLLTEVGNLLVTNGLGTASVDIYGGRYPSSPDNLIAIFEQSPFPTVDSFGGLKQVVHNLQVLVRNKKYTDAETKAKAVFAVLHRFRGVLDGVQYDSIWARSVPFSIGPDENNRSQWSCNYIVRKAVA